MFLHGNKYCQTNSSRQDKTTTDILEAFVSFKQDLFLEMRAKITSLENKIDRFLDQKSQDTTSKGVITSPAFKNESPEEERIFKDYSHKKHLEFDPHSESRQAQTLPSSSEIHQMHPPLESRSLQSEDDQIQTNIDDDAGNSESELVESGEQGEPVAPHPPSIPFNHTTPASKLLLVGPIQALTSGAPSLKNKSKTQVENFPIEREERRGILRLFGRGEGLDRPPGYDKEPSEYVSETTSPETPISEVSTPPAPGEEWGQLGGLTPPGDDYIPRVTRGAVINSLGMPDFRRETVERLARSYNDNINIMHPILVPKNLNALIEDFLKSIPENRAKSKQIDKVQGVGIGFAVRNQINFVESPGNKRRRSPGSITDHSVDFSGLSEHKPGHPFRSISTALVLLVMALGAICESRQKIPDLAELALARDGDSEAGNSPVARNGYPQSPQQSSPIMPTPGGLPSPLDNDGMQSRSRRTSLEEGAIYSLKSSSIKPKNLDHLSSLAYFAIATDILGNQLGGNSLQHVHAHILASLYHGQLGRVLESHAYISNACRSIQNILRP
jgi:hypothetical protein